MRNGLLLLLLAAFINPSINAQSVEEMTRERDAKTTELGTLEGELGDLQGRVDGLKADVASLTDQITPYPRWNSGAFGTIGLNFANFSDWLQKDQANTAATTIGMGLNGFANLDQEKYFWRNGASINLGWLKFDDKDDPDDSDEFKTTTDAFNITSLFGYKLSEKLALSALGEYRTALLDKRFNNPGYLDFGVGITWTPITNLVVVIHPLNYNFVFGDDPNYQSSPGAKIVADYTARITEGVAWRSNLSAFMSYQSGDLSNWTWVNNFSTAVKGVGIGLDIGLRSSKQEALVELGPEADNPLQTFWVLGLSYALGTK